MLGVTVLLLTANVETHMRKATVLKSTPILGVEQPADGAAICSLGGVLAPMAAAVGDAVGGAACWVWALF